MYIHRLSRWKVEEWHLYEMSPLISQILQNPVLPCL